MNWKVPRCKTYGYIMIQKKMVKRESCTFLFRLPQCSPRVYIDIFQDNKCGINDKIRLLPFCNHCWKEEWWLIASKTKTQKWMPSGKLHNRSVRQHLSVSTTHTCTHTHTNTHPQNRKRFDVHIWCDTIGIIQPHLQL